MLTKKTEAAIRAYVKQTDPRDVAYGDVIGGRGINPGPHRVLPVIGWLRQEKGQIYLALSCFLLRIYEDEPRGTLGWNIPLNDRTEKTVCSLLTSLGWDGRVWPLDRGWPDGLQEEKGLKTLLREAKVFASFVFPPEEQGSRVLRVEIAKSSGVFPLSPVVPADDLVEPSLDQLLKLHRLMEDPGLFAK